MKEIGIAVGGIFTIIVLFFLSTLMIMLGWYLFAIPVFGLKMIAFWQAFGFSILIGVVRGPRYQSKS